MHAVGTLNIQKLLEVSCAHKLVDLVFFTTVVFSVKY